MIPYQCQTLANGLSVIVNRDRTSKLAAVNLLYKVGARDEAPCRTGLAHLFEHLMFRGTHEVPDFDLPVQMACGDSNAFTNNDYTDFYITLPAANLETAFWLESDRMTGLALTSEAFETEKRVVLEEFKQRYLNQPYGDQQMLLRSLAYRRHPYRWATIGRKPEDIAETPLEAAEAFYRRFYHPSNAILSVSADIDPDEVFGLAEKWFGGIADTAPDSPRDYPAEPEQREARSLTVERDVPATALTMAFPMGDRLSRSFYLGDLTSDILAGGDSSRLYERLVKGKRLFSSVNAYITGDVGPGLFVFTGQLLPSTSEEAAVEAFRAEIAGLQRTPVDRYEIEKVKNKFEANTLFGELNVMNKALNLGFYRMLGDLPLVNREVEIYRSLSPDEVIGFCRDTLREERCSTLIYRSAR